MPLLVNIPIDSIVQLDGQPREIFDERELSELAKSMHKNGLIEPLVVRPWNGGYELVAGERRLRAAKMLRWDTIDCIVRDMGDRDAYVASFIENFNRSQLNPVETAKAMKRMIDEGMTADEVGEAIGKDSGYVNWLLQILHCCDTVLDLVVSGHIGPWVAWHLGRLSRDGQIRALRKFNSEKLDAQEMVSFCKMIYAQENQLEMFKETKLSPEQMKALRTVRSAIQRAYQAFRDLRKLEEKGPGVVATANETWAILVLKQVKELKQNLTWLEKKLKEKKMLKGANDE